MIRSFDWRDFPVLHRYRKHGVWLDSSLELTRWLTFVPVGALMATFAPATGVYTYVSRGNGYPGLPIIGQVFHPPSTLHARLTFIAPTALVKSPGVTELLDYLSVQVGKRGAHNLVAEVAENAPMFEVLRSGGYAVFARQRIWKLSSGLSTEKEVKTPWRSAMSRDEVDLRLLYGELVPPLIQQAEPPPWDPIEGVVYRENGRLMAYISLHHGPRGVWARPFIHPEVEHVAGRLVSLYNHLPNRRSRPVYLAIRSNQAWLESHLNEIGAKVGPRQAVMVKRMAVREKVFRPITVPGLEQAQPEASSTTLLPSGNRRMLDQNLVDR